MSANHNANVTVNVTLDPSPVQAAGFGKLLYLCAQATNSLNSARRVTYANASEAAADQTAGYISATTLAFVQAAFAQRPKPAEVKVARVNRAGAETEAQAIAAVIAVDSDFYGVALDLRTDTEIDALADYVETAEKRMLFVFQSADASWLDAGVPSGFSSLTSYERTIGIYHDTAAEPADVAYLANRLVWDPDDQSAPWHGCPLSSVDAYATGLTTAQRTAAIANNINLGLEQGGEDFVVDPGVNLAGRPVYEVLTADWFETRLRERINELVVAHSARGQKVTIDSRGQAKILSVIQGLYDQAIAAGHFLQPDEDDEPIVAETISTADLTARRMRFTIRAQIAVGARLFTFNCNFSRDALSA